jgi:hypothetical protein
MVACEVLCNLAEGLPGSLAGSSDMLQLLFSATGTYGYSLIRAWFSFINVYL